MVVVVVGRIMGYSLSDVFSVSYSCLTTFRTWLNDFNELKQIKAAAAAMFCLHDDINMDGNTF